MKLFIVITISFLLYSAGIFLNAQSFNWAKSAGGSGSDQGYSISVDANSNVYVCGWFSNSAVFGTETLTSFGMQDIFIACYDSAGNFKWVRQAGSPGNEVCAGIITDAGGNSFITGWFSETSAFENLSVTSQGSYDMFIAKYNSTGEIQWVKSGGGKSDDYGNRITLTSDDGICIAGSFRDTIHVETQQLISRGDRDILLARYDKDGNFVFARRAGGMGEDRAYGIYETDDQNFVFTGLFSGQAWFGNEPVVSTAIISTYVAKITENGDFIWVKSAGGNANDFARGFEISADNEGNIVSTGFFSGTVKFDNTVLNATGGQYDFDIYLARYSPDGNLIWAKNAGGIGIDHGLGIYSTTDGSFFLSGFYNQIGYFDNMHVITSGKSDVFVAKYMPDGNVSWVVSGGGQENDYGYSLMGDATGNIFLTGVFQNTAEFGQNLIHGSGGNDIFIAKIPSGSNRIFNPFAGGFIDIFPNPSNETLNIRFQNYISGQSELSYQIADITGKTIKSGLISLPSDSNTGSIDISNFKTGTYIINLTGNQFSVAGKFIVE